MKILEITSCMDCPNLAAERHHTADSFEIEYEWSCKVSGMKHIAYVDWTESDQFRVKIPSWCPLKDKE
jgi:hypothetical protein